MWTCPKCGRIFEKKGQVHSCRKIPLEQHFKNKALAKELFDHLVSQINQDIGECKIISIPCCVHLFGTYDFLAALPKKDGLEVRFALDREIDDERRIQTVPLSSKSYKNCLFLKSVEDVNTELISWLSESYHLKD